MNGFLAGATPSTLETVRTAVVKGVTDASGEMTTTLTDILPVVIGVIAAVVVVTFGIKLFKKFTAKA